MIKENLNTGVYKNGYTHFAVSKESGKIVNGWEYRGYDPADLRQFKKDYFFNDLSDMGFNPLDIKILTLKGLKKYGIDPNDDRNWSNGLAEMQDNCLKEEILKILTEERRLVNNFPLVEKLLEFKSNDDFYFVQIIKRYKDNKDNNAKRQGQKDGIYHGGAWYLKSWRIHSVEELNALKPEIIKNAEENNARAYISINFRSEQETNNYVKLYCQKFSKGDPRITHADDIVAGQAKSGENWQNVRLRLFLDVDCPKDATIHGYNIWQEVKDMLQRYKIESIGEYETPSGGLHIILANKNSKNLAPFKKELTKFDNWIYKGLQALVHPNEDGKIILYSNVDTKGY